MKWFLSPTLQVTLALLSLTLSLVLIASSLGLIPNEDRWSIELRARLSENLAIQLASLAGRNDAVAIKDTIESVISRNNDVLSIAIRGADGKMLLASTDHASHWVEPADGKSTAIHVQVPLLNAEAPGGRIEIAFRPLATVSNIFGLSRTVIGLVGFMLAAGFPGFYFILRRALRELDPSRAIPERVKAAFDTLAEGVLITDERQYIVLANDAFARQIYHADDLIGTSISELPWLQSSTRTAVTEAPWRSALQTTEPVLGVPLSIRHPSGEMRRLLVNATRIVDGSRVVRGVIVTFDDVTVLFDTNLELKLTIDQLNLSQQTISEQNQQLRLLASSDSLTGCLNRRCFFAEAESALQVARNRRQAASLLMLDVDYFKRINDRFGHVVGDEVLVGLVDVLRRTCRASDLVGRYGGEEFCILVAGLGAAEVAKLADRIRLGVADVRTWLPNGERITVSIGIASLDEKPSAVADLVGRADQALYVAKATGRNRVINWNNMPARVNAPPLAELSEQDSPVPLVPHEQDLY